MFPRHVSREECRRLTLPTIVSGLAILGPLHSIQRSPTWTSITFLCREYPLTLKFSDEDAARDEGYLLDENESIDHESLVPACIGVNCGRGCGCRCVKDYGYVAANASLENTGYQVCCSDHAEPQPLIHETGFTLKTTNMMIDEIVATFIQSTLDAARNRIAGSAE